MQRIEWFHFEAEIAPEVEAEGPEAVQAFADARFDAQSQALHGVGYHELKELVDEAAAEAVAALPADAGEEPRRAAINAAAAAVFAQFRAGGDK